MQYRGIQLTCPEDMPPAEAEVYADQQILRWHNKTLSAVRIEIDPDEPAFVIITATERQAFDRIRRITGYLTGTVGRWNNAKQAELNDRAKHG